MLDAIFIVGTGRSGTHFLCRSLRGFENIDDFRNGRENLDILYKITRLALTHRPLSSNIIEYYKKEIKTAKKHNKIFLDQHHPNLFHVDQLIKEFPNAIFLATDRPTEQIVASMLNHSGVRRWADDKNNKTYAYPNQFLGVTSHNELNDKLHIICSKRVHAHNFYREELIKKHPNYIKRVKFTDLVNGQFEYFNKIFDNFELKSFGKYTEIEVANQETLTKFSKTISKRQLTDLTS